MDAEVGKILRLFDANRLEAFEERAAIVQYEGGMDRLTAERLACLDVVATHGLPGRVQALHVEIAGSSEWVLTSDVQGTRTTLKKVGAKHIVVLPVEPQGFENRRAFPPQHGHRPGRR